MELSFPSLFACSLSLTVLTCVFYVFMKGNFFLKRIGIVSAYIFSLFIIIRGCLPFDFTGIHLTKTYASTAIIPGIQRLMEIPLVSYKGYHLPVISLLVILWVTVGFILLLRKISGFLIYRRKLNAFLYTPPQETMDIFHSACCSVHAKKASCYRVAVLKSLATPAVFGILHPVILIPDNRYTEEELHYIFIHELLHIKYKDFILKIFSDLIAAIHWWNPVISVLFPSLLRQVQELHIDHIITRHLQAKKKYPYLDSLQKSLSNGLTSGKRSPDITYSLCNTSSEEKFRQRLFFIMSPRVKTSSRIAILLSAVLLFFSFTFVFEAFHLPKYSEHGEKVYYPDEDASYFLKKKSGYDLFLNGEYVYTTPAIPGDLDDLPVYENIPE